MKKSLQILYDYRGTGTKPDSSDEEPEGEIFFFRWRRKHKLEVNEKNSVGSWN